MTNPFLNGIMGFAVGDALGAPAEFGERWMRDMDPVREMRSGGIFEVPPGGWTDDTAMTLATLESLKHGFDPKDMMNRFTAWCMEGAYTWSGEAIGIGKQILRAIEAYRAGGDIESCGCAAESDNGNGSLMRILPVSLYCRSLQQRGLSLPEALHMIAQASALTHRHPRSIIACGIYHFLVCAILDEPGTLPDRIQSGLSRGFAFYRSQPVYSEELNHYDRLANIDFLAAVPRDQINSTGYVVDTLEAALWCLVTTDSYRACALKAVNLGLDTDTIAAIAGGLAGLFYGLKAIPAEWLSALQNRDQIESACAFFSGVPE